MASSGVLPGRSSIQTFTCLQNTPDDTTCTLLLSRPLLATHFHMVIIKSISYGLIRTPKIYKRDCVIIGHS